MYNDRESTEQYTNFITAVNQIASSMTHRSGLPQVCSYSRQRFCTPPHSLHLFPFAYLLEAQEAHSSIPRACKWRAQLEHVNRRSCGRLCWPSTSHQRRSGRHSHALALDIGRALPIPRALNASNKLIEPKIATGKQYTDI